MKSFIPFIVMAVCVGMYFVYIKPTLAVIDVRKAKYEEYKNVLDKVKEIKEKRDALSAKYNNISDEDLARLSKMIPQKFVSEYFVNDVNSMAARAGMRISQIDVSIPSLPEGATEETQIGSQKFTTITSRFTISGRLDNFLSFLKDLESSLRLIDVISLTARSGSASKDKPGDSNMDYSLEVRTYSLK